MIQQAMLAAWLEEFIRKVVALLPHPERPAPPPLPEPVMAGEKTLAGVRDAGLRTYSGYPVHCQQILACHAWLSTCPGPLPPPPGGGGMMP